MADGRKGDLKKVENWSSFQLNFTNVGSVSGSNPGPLGAGKSLPDIIELSVKGRLLREIAQLNMTEALQKCDLFASFFREELITFWRRHGDPDEHRAVFALLVTQSLLMPRGLTNGISTLTPNFDPTTKATGGGSIGDFGEARRFILRKLSNKHDPRVPAAKARSWETWFYPEYDPANSPELANPRDRICKIAQDHAGLTSGDLMQTALYSLNGFFDEKDAATSANPQGTTCALFVRACRAAAGVLEKRDWATNCLFSGGGKDPAMDFCIGQGSSIPYKPGAAMPLRGDFFHIAKYNFNPVTKAYDYETNSDHTGIIVRVIPDPNEWKLETVEAGQGTHNVKGDTQYFQRSVKVNSYPKDPFALMGQKHLDRWVNLDGLPHTR